MALGEIESAKGLVAFVRKRFDRRQAQAELTIRIAAAIQMPMLCRSRIMN